MKVNKATIDLIKNFEGLRLEAYLCSALVPTIGYGSTFYENGIKVKLGQKITKQRAEELLDFMVLQFANQVRPLIKVPLSENRFGALVSFAYNVGIGALSKSTLLKKVNTNPNDPSIKMEFLRWNKAGGKILAGLTKRREAEAKLYFT
jgi:lysozyme